MNGVEPDYWNKNNKMAYYAPNYKSYCDHCERFTIMCGKCGMNACSGGNGEMFSEDPDVMVPCDQCDSAHEEEQALWRKDGNT